MAKAEPLKIVSFVARNTKKLKAVRIDPDPLRPIVVLTGKNRQGKTSVLDSIWYALGGQKSIPGKPIRDGETEAMVCLDLGQFIVERRFTANGAYLEVKTKEGFKAPSPQTFLASRLGDRAQNPLEFMRLRPDEQVKALQGMISVTMDLADIEQLTGLPTKNVKEYEPIELLDLAYKHLFEKRTEVNAEVKRLEGAAKSAKIQIPSGKENTEPVSVTDLFASRKVLEQERYANDLERSNLVGIKVQHDQRMNEMTLLEKRITETEALLAQLQDNRKALTLKIDVLDADYQTQAWKVDSLVDPAFEEVDAQIAAADETNKVAQAVQQYRTFMADLEKTREKSEEFTGRLTAIKEYKSNLIINAGLPVPGLGFESGEVTFNGIPLSQASTAEQIEISCAICMASHPEIGILTLDVGWSELDSESKGVLLAWAEKSGIQIWVTRVTDEPDGDGFFIEDGMVTAIDGKTVEELAPVYAEPVPVDGKTEMVTDPVPF